MTMDSDGFSLLDVCSSSASERGLSGSEDEDEGVVVLGRVSACAPHVRRVLIGLPASMAVLWLLGAAPAVRLTLIASNFRGMA